MAELTVEDIWSLDDYREQRDDYCAKVISYKLNRQVELMYAGQPKGWLHFEDAITVRHQVQEMLFESGEDSEDAIVRELSRYQSLIPDGTNLKATLIIDLSDPQMLARVAGVARDLKLAISGFDAIGPEDNPLIDEISTVYFLTWSLTDEMRDALLTGASISVFSNNEMFTVDEQLIDNEVRDTIVTDLL